MHFDGYQVGEFYDEMFLADGSPRRGTAVLFDKINGLSDGELARRQQAAQLALRNMGITFTVYGTNRERSGFSRLTSFRGSSNPTNGSGSSAVCGSVSRR